MKATTPRTAIGLMAGLLAAGFWSPAACEDKLSGSIAGLVTDSIGIPQMGAAVLLFNQQERLVHRALTDETGAFLFGALKPDVYSIRVTLASFVPAVKRNILVQPGMRSLLSVNLTGLLSSIELVYSSKGTGALMSEDWKWVLRTASVTRPVLRIVPRIDISDPSQRSRSSIAAFSDTRGLVAISAGDEGQVSAYGNQPDLGTAFALATSLFGSNELLLSGNLGYSAASGTPTAGLSTRLSREGSGWAMPEVRVTMRQMFLPARIGTALLAGNGEGVPALRTMSVGFLDRTQLTDNLKFEYGFSLESVSFLERLNYFSPYARATYDDGDTGALEFAYSSGVPPAEALTFGKEPGAVLQQDLAALSLFPRVSLRSGRARVQRLENYEVGYRKTFASRTYSIAAYRETMTNAALTMVAAAGAFPATELLPDLFSNSSVFNIGDYTGVGYMLSVTQALGDSISATAAFGSGNALVAASDELRKGTPDELRGQMRYGRSYWMTTKVSASSRWSGTQLVTSYRWAGRSLTPGHMYLTQALRPEIGWNIYVRQPIPAVSGLPGRLEASADLRNLLAQGYQSISLPQGRKLSLMHTPRSLRGGVSFIF